MTDRYVGYLTAVLMATSILLHTAEAAALANETQPLPAPLCSRDATSPWNTTGPLESGWQGSPPAAKVVAEACESVDVAALAGEDLTDYLRTTSEDCLVRTLHTSENPSIRGDLPTIFNDANMQSVFAEIEESAPAYDGTNSTGMLQLWFFVETGYTYHRFFLDETGVGPFNEATDSAYLAASDAFAASDHFNAPDDEAARILFYYFEVAYSSGMRQNHLAPIKQVLSGLTPERAAGEISDPQPRAFVWALQRVHNAFRDHNQTFIEALAQDPEFVDVMLQVTRYDYFFLLEEDHPFTPRLGLLETAVEILVRLTEQPSSREAAISALTSVLSWHERIGTAFLVAAQGLENQVDCTSLNICRDVLEEEILTQGLANTYSFDNGELVFVTSLELEEVGPMYQAAKEVQAQFFRLVETDRPVREGKEVFTAKIYGTRTEYTVYERYLSNVDTRGIHRGGFYSLGAMATFVRDDLEEVFRHEYVHYLADRFGLLIGSPWFDEGLAEFLLGSTGTEGIPVRWDLVRMMVADEPRLDLAEIFDSQYSADLGGSRFYFYSGLFFSFLHRERRTQLFELFDIVRDGDQAAYNALTVAWAADTQLAANFTAFLDAEAATFEWSTEPPATTAFPRLEALTSDSAEEIGNALRDAGGNLGLDCRSAETEFGHRFECAGSLSPDSLFKEDRGALNRHFNNLLDGFMASAVERGEINNFQFMTCYFANLTGSPPVADLACEGPLRPEGLAAAQVDLKTTLVSQSGSSAKVGGDLRLRTTLDFPEQAAANVTLTWSASLPVRFSAYVDGRGWCDIFGKSGQAGAHTCGHIDKSETELPLTIELNMVPLQAGSLDFSVQFSSDEAEVAPEDNAASLQFEISLAPEEIASLEGHALGVVAVAFSPDGTMLASGSPDSTVKLWDVETRTNTATLSGHTDYVRSVAFSPDGRILAAGVNDGTIKLWDVETRTNTATIEGHTGPVRSVDFSDGTTLASGSDDHTVKLWDIEAQTNTATLVAHDSWVAAVAFSPDGTTLASGADDNTIRLWDVETGRNTATLEEHTSRVFSVGFSRDGTMLLSASADRTVRLWDLETRRSTATFRHGEPVRSVDISPEGSTLVSTGRRDIMLWDVATGRNVASLEGHTSFVEFVTFSPDGATVASASLDRTVKLWNVSRWTMTLPGSLVRLTGDRQQGPAGDALAHPFVVFVRDQQGKPLEGAEVTFAVTAGGGTLSATTATTDEHGRAAATLTLGNQPGASTVTASAAGLDPVTFTATAEATPDFDGDGETGFSDFFLFADAFGGSDPRFDLDGSGSVDFADFFLLADHFGDPARGKLMALAREMIGLPDGPQLQQNAPNPFNSQTVISWFLLRPGAARVEVFALTGQRVTVLYQGPRKAGVHRVHWDGRDDRGRPLASGVYLYRLVTDERVQTRKLTLLR